MDFTKMMGGLKEAQEKMKQAQEALVHIEVTGESGAGLVKVTANARKQIKAIEIDPSLLSKEDQEMVQDLVVAAVNKAMENADEKAREELKNSASNLLPNIPGLDLSRFM